jgi:arylsulfatase
MKFRFFEQPEGWTGPKPISDMPTIINLRQDPFERFVAVQGQTLLTGAPGYMMDFFAREFWRFVMVQDKVAQLGQTAIDYPPMQDPASFNLEEVKKQIDALIKAHEAHEGQ